MILFRTSPPWSARQQRHLAHLAEFTRSIVLVSGKKNVLADALSCPISPVSTLNPKPNPSSVSPGPIKPCSAQNPDLKPSQLSSKPIQLRAIPVPSSKVSEASEVSMVSVVSDSSPALFLARGKAHSSKKFFLV